MRLMLVSEEGFIGGAQIAVAQLLRSLSNRSVECSAVVPMPSDYSRLLRNNAIDVSGCRLDELKRDFVRGLPVRREIANLRDLLRQFQPTVIHADAPWAAFFCILASSKTGPPIVCALHSYPEAHRAFKRVVFSLLKRCLVKRCRSFVVFSDLMLREVGRKHGFPQRKLVRASYGLDPQRIEARVPRNEWRTRFGLPPGAVVFATLTRLHPEKGVLDLVEAAKIVCEECPEAHFVVAGEEVVTPMEHLGFLPILKSRITALGLEQRFQLIGFQHDVGSILNASDVLIHPSHREPFGLAVIEASAAGLPAIVSNVGGMLETVVDGETGFHFTARDPRHLAEKALTLTRNPALRREMGQRGKESVLREYPPDAMTDGMLAIYEDAMSSIG